MWDSWHGAVINWLTSEQFCFNSKLSSPWSRSNLPGFQAHLPCLSSIFESSWNLFTVQAIVTWLSNFQPFIDGHCKLIQNQFLQAFPGWHRCPADSRSAEPSCCSHPWLWHRCQAEEGNKETLVALNKPPLLLGSAPSWRALLASSRRPLLQLSQNS